MKRNKYNRSFPHILTQFFDDPMTRTVFQEDWSNYRRPPVNIEETDANFAISVLSPGRDKANFHIELKDGELTISYQHAEQENTEATTAPKFVRKEFNLINFKRRFELDEQIIDGEQISASYVDGVLHINLPKREAAIVKEPKQILVG
ncbi:MAG: Hsp20/alpha crystallin family protein [Bacteroidota bacterium]